MANAAGAQPTQGARDRLETVTAYVPPDLAQRVREAARANRRSVSAQLAIWVEEGLEKGETEQ